MLCHQTCNFKYILVIYIYREYFLLYYWEIAIQSNIYWGDTNDGQQTITPTNVDKGLGRRYQSITKQIWSVSSYGTIRTNKHSVAMGYGRESKNELALKYRPDIRIWWEKILWNYEGMIGICDITPLNG